MVFRPHQRRQTLDIQVSIQTATINTVERVKETVFYGANP